MLAQHKGRVLIGMAARPGGPVEVAALAGETPISSEDLSFAVDGKPVTAVSCGRACSRLDVDAFNGARRRITVNAPGRFEFVLPKALPVRESRLFASVQSGDALPAYAPVYRGADLGRRRRSAIDLRGAALPTDWRFGPATGFARSSSGGTDGTSATGAGSARRSRAFASPPTCGTARATHACWDRRATRVG